MRTRFDVVLHGDADRNQAAQCDAARLSVVDAAGDAERLADVDAAPGVAAQSQDLVAAPAWLQAAGAEALAEIEAAEKRFNFYDPESWLSRVNQNAASGPTRVPPDVFELLQLCQEMHQQTGGRFDPAVGSRTNFSQVALDPSARSVHFTAPGMQLDLGGIAKGWAIDLAAEALLDAEVTSALVQGGSSTIRAIGSPPGQRGWKVEIGSAACTWLHHQALGVSHSFADDGSTSGPTCHIINPVDGEPLRQPRLAAALSPASDSRRAAAIADAWSTALLVPGSSQSSALLGARPDRTFPSTHSNAEPPSTFLWKPLP
jgi:FAD:protein FMN transferase